MTRFSLKVALLLPLLAFEGAENPPGPPRRLLARHKIL